MNIENNPLNPHLICEIEYFTAFSVLKKLIEEEKMDSAPMLLLPNSMAFRHTIFSGSRDSYSVLIVICCM